MKKLTIELEAEKIVDFIPALKQAIIGMEFGNTSMDLKDEDVQKGFCSIVELKEEIDN